MEEGISWKLGRGDRILFWKHKWLEIGCLADVFPVIFNIAADQDALVIDYYVSSWYGRDWNIRLRRNINDWEIVDYLQLMELLHSASWSNSEDTLIWKRDRNGMFNVCSFYDVLKDDVADTFPWIKIWRSVAPSRVIFFTWRAAQGKILTIDNLKVRGFSMVNRCSLCFNSEENINHLFIHCSWTAEIWSLVLSCFGVHFCPPKDLKSFLLSWWGQTIGKGKKEVWHLLPLCLFWIVWKERNRRIFENEERTIVKVKSMFLNCLFNSASASSEITSSSLLHFIDSLGKVS